MAVNRDLTIEVGKKAKEAGVPQLIFMSSAIVYGDSDPCDVFNPITKETPVNPSNFYGLSKVEAEIGLMELCDSSFKVAILRCPIIYGPGCKGNFPTLAKIARIIPVFPNIENRRSMLYVGNLAELVAILIESGRGGLYLPQNAEWSSTPQLVKALAEAQGKKLTLVDSFSSVLRSVFGNSNAYKKAFGNLFFDKSCSDSQANYQIYSLEESLKSYSQDSDIKVSSENTALVLTSVASMVDQFLMPSISLLQSLGYSVVVAADFEKPGTIPIDRAVDLQRKLREMGVDVYQVGIPRSLDPKKVIEAYGDIRSLKQQHRFRLVHCHSPIGGALCRIAFRNDRQMGTRVIYTAHGFHFYDGAPLINWLLYFPAEWICSWFTDVIITINKEDFSRAKSKLHSREVAFIPGIGIDLSRFSAASSKRGNARRALGLSEHEFMLLSIGELNKNKNHEAVVHGLMLLRDQDWFNELRYFICGEGVLSEEISGLIEANDLSERVTLLGYRTDIPELLSACDTFVFPSKREGLPVALMEAMASGLPVICAPIRGCLDLVEDGKTGLLAGNEPTQIAQAISMLKNCGELRKELSAAARERVKSCASVEVLAKLRNVYEKAVTQL